jgi:hypothetical protein
MIIKTPKLSWRKCPSVRPGGKTFFYVLFTPCNINPGTRNKWSVVWDRQGLTWIIKCENMTTGRTIYYGVAQSPALAKFAAESYEQGVNLKANLDAIKGRYFLGSGPTRGYWAGKY